VAEAECKQDSRWLAATVENLQGIFERASMWTDTLV